MNDTLIVFKNGKNSVERYAGQNLDEYDHIAELDHKNLVEYKVNEFSCMNGISYDSIFEYLKKEFGYRF